MTTETTKKNFEPRKIEEQRFEFILYINNHIVCQRYFNVRDYNEKVVNSFELKELMDNICGMSNDKVGTMGIIPNYLKNKSVDFLWGNYNRYNSFSDYQPRNIFEKIDDFQFEIKVDKKTIAKSTFTGNYFPQKIRYAVDIKEIISEIISEIRYFFNLDEYTIVKA